MSETFIRAAAIAARLNRPLATALQLALVVVSNRLAFLLRFDGDVPSWAEEAFWLMLPWIVAVRAFTFVPFRLYEGLWRYTSMYDLRAIAGGVGTSTVIVFLLTHAPWGPDVYPRSIFIVDALLLTLLLGGVRLSRRLSAELSRGKVEKRVLIFGATDAGELIVRDMKHNTSYRYQPIGFVDDDASKTGQRIHGVPVLGTSAELSKILPRCRPDEVLLALPDASPEAVRAVVRTLAPFKVPIKTLPNLRAVIDGAAELSQIRSLAVEDLLARAPVGLDPEPVKHLVAGRRVLVTGAGGSIGSELCRQIAKLKPASLIMLERYENGLHAIRMELEDARGQFGLQPVVGDVTDAVLVRKVMRQHQPEIVFHAAAHKHVPLMEENPCESIKNNVRGTRILAEIAEEFDVDRFILISTDKAVNPTSVMGASKRLAELVIQRRAIGSGTSFAIVRFGNVLASNGSVVPRFVEQIKKGGPVTITHPEIRRFFMLIPEAVQLVLHAAAQARSGATYVLEMGEQIRLLDMARDIIRLSGFVPEEEIPITFVGLRPGEKLYEELVGRDEDVGPSAIEKILRVTSRTPPPPALPTLVNGIERAAVNGDTQAVLAALRELTGLGPVADPAVLPAEEDRSAVEAPVAAAAVVEVPEGFARASAGIIEQPCPNCHSSSLQRSRARTLSERVRRNHSDKRLFRCPQCDWRGWLLPLEFGPSEEAVAADGQTTGIDFAALDSGVERFQGPVRRSFSPRELR